MTDYTIELTQLLVYAGRVGTAIRALSAEAAACKGMPLPGAFLQPDPEGQDIRWLADSIENFQALATAIQSGDPRMVAKECQWRLNLIQQYREHGFCYGPGDGLKEFPAVLGVDLAMASKAIEAIQQKAQIGRAVAKLTSQIEHQDRF